MTFVFLESQIKVCCRFLDHISDSG